MILLKEQKTDKLHEIMPDPTKENIQDNVTIILKNPLQIMQNEDECVSDQWINLKKYYCLTLERPTRSEKLIYYIQKEDLDIFEIDVNVLKRKAMENLESTNWRKYKFVEYMITKGTPMTALVDTPNHLPISFGFTEKTSFPYMKDTGSIFDDFFIITNRFNANGSSFLCCNSEMNKLYEKIGSFYIFPSSKDETICIKSKVIEERGKKVFLDSDGAEINFAKEELYDLCMTLNQKNKTENILTQSVYFFGGDYLMKVK